MDAYGIYPEKQWDVNDDCINVLVKQCHKWQNGILGRKLIEYNYYDVTVVIEQVLYIYLWKIHKMRSWSNPKKQRYNQ